MRDDPPAVLRHSHHGQPPLPLPPLLPLLLLLRTTKTHEHSTSMLGPWIDAQLPWPALTTGRWWWGMCGVNVWNGLWLASALRSKARPPGDALLARLATVYVAVAAFRSTFPVLWETKPVACLFSTPGMYAGGRLVDQLLAHCAE